MSGFTRPFRVVRVIRVVKVMMVVSRIRFYDGYSGRVIKPF